MTRELKPKFIRDMTEDEIRAKVKDLRESIFNLEFRNTMKQLDNPLELRNQRREIARLLTILREHESGLRKLSTVSSRGGGR